MGSCRDYKSMTADKAKELKYGKQIKGNKILSSSPSFSHSTLIFEGFGIVNF